MFQEIGKKLRSRTLSDDRFDALYPTSVRALSERFWTPLKVAAAAADMFVGHGARRVLDVGAGPGKFCVAAAAAAPQLDLTGIEHRSALVAMARMLAKSFALSNVRFRHEDVTTADWTRYDGFYFFNPFGENLFAAGSSIDATVDLSVARFVEETYRAERMLLAARLGTIVVTFHGFGGRMPACFTPVPKRRGQGGYLRAWRKEQVGHLLDGYWIEKPNGRLARAPFFDASDR